MTDVQKFHLERIADIMVVFGIFCEMRSRQWIPAVFTIINDKGHHGNILFLFSEQVMVILGNLIHHIVVDIGLVLGNNAHK